MDFPHFSEVHWQDRDTDCYKKRKNISEVSDIIWNLSQIKGRLLVLLNLFHIKKWNSTCVFTESPTDIFICNCMYKVIERVPSPQRLAGYLPTERRAGRRLFEENMRGEATFFHPPGLRRNQWRRRNHCNGGGGTTKVSRCCHWPLRRTPLWAAKSLDWPLHLVAPP